MSSVVSAVNLVLTSLTQWSSSNSLRINKLKTKAVIFHAKGKQEINPPALYLGDTLIEYVEKFCSLGVLFTPTLSWDDHVTQTCAKLSRVIGITFRNKDLLPVQTKLLLYYAFFYSSLTYYFLVWGSTTLSNTLKLQTLQKRMLRTICNASYDAPTWPIYLNYNIVPVHRFLDYRFACFCKKATQRNDNFFSSLVALQPHDTPYATRNPHTFVVPRCRTNYGLYMLRYVLPKFLNTTFCHDLPNMFFSMLRSHFIRDS
ncbi:uncharacterized protein LOC144175398 [Haemaphysalis longicornis]